MKNLCPSPKFTGVEITVHQLSLLNVQINLFALSLYYRRVNKTFFMELL